jgi:hypothetical protein
METQNDNPVPPWRADIITIPPTIETVHTRIWQVDISQFEAAKALGGVALWLIEAPWAHPLWHSYVLSLVSLRPVEGQPPPVCYFDGATHEMMLMALDPDEPRQPMFDEMAFEVLMPANFGAQMIVETDAEATAKVAAAVAMIAKGELNPDTDAIAQWVGLFGDSMMLNRSTKH